MRHWAEEIARDHLLARGFDLLEENYPLRQGELDLVMRDGETVVFVEVRQRSRDDYGSAAESLGRRKLERLWASARLYLLRQFGRDDVPARVDAVLIQGNRTSYELEHLEGIA